MSSIIRGSDSFDSKDVNVGTAKAFVNFDGTGTVAIRGTPHNVSSITDNGVGNYTVNLSITKADTDCTTLITSGAG